MDGVGIHGVSQSTVAEVGIHDRSQPTVPGARTSGVSQPTVLGAGMTGAGESGDGEDGTIHRRTRTDGDGSSQARHGLRRRQTNSGVGVCLGDLPQRPAEPVIHQAPVPSAGNELPARRASPVLAVHRRSRYTDYVGYCVIRVIIYKFYMFTSYNTLIYVSIYCYDSLQCSYTVIYLVI